MAQDSNDANPSADDRLQTMRLPTPRKNCPWKARRIADYLQGIEGVVETSLKPRSDTVIVTYDPARTSEEAITAAIESPTSGTVKNSTRSRSGRQSGGCRFQCRGRPM